MPFNIIRTFIHFESAAGILLIMAATFAFGMDNSPWHDIYSQMHTASLSFHTFTLSYEFLINHGLMAIFFLLVGLEIKREIIEGNLNSPAKILLPSVAAFGGMLVPACIYLSLNMSDAIAVKGWGTPVATDIAFALGVLTLLGTRIPLTLKVFLTALAILDDLGAITIIAVFYTAHINFIAFSCASLCFVTLYLFNKYDINYLTPYLIVGVLLWISLWQSGIDATIAGVLLAITIPLRAQHQPLHRLEKKLHPWVTFIVLPIFAFMNAGVYIGDLKPSLLFTSIPLGIALGLLIGKPLGILSACWLTIKTGFASLPRKINWSLFIGMSILCGIGFTMSLFIGALAFGDLETSHIISMRIGVLMGSLSAGTIGYVWLRLASKRHTL